MRRLSLLIVMVMLVQGLYGQLLDSAAMRFQYLVKAKNYAGSENIREDWSYLDIGGKYSKYYSAYQHFSDSTSQSLTSLGLSPAEVFEKTRNLKDGSPDNIYKDNINNTLTFTSRIIAQKYWYKEDLARQNWVLGSDTLTIEGYLCFKSKCRFRGREWIAWYTPDIPISNGPWKLGGLPGLILKAEDLKGEFCFECKGIAQLNPHVAITLPLESSKNDYVKTDGKTFMQIKRKSVEDIKGSIAAQGMTILSVTDENGQESELPKNLMNAIEVYE